MVEVVSPKTETLVVEVDNMDSLPRPDCDDCAFHYSQLREEP